MINDYFILSSYSLEISSRSASSAAQRKCRRFKGRFLIGCTGSCQTTSGAASGGNVVKRDIFVWVFEWSIRNKWLSNVINTDKNTGNLQ